MKCKYCKQEIPEGSIFCMYCGERIARQSKGKKKYPKYRTLSDGTLLGQLMVDGNRQTVKAASLVEYRAKCDALRAGFMEMKERPERRLLGDIIRRYIDSNDSILSPATIRGYEVIYRNRFKAYMQQPICDIDFQRMINDEAKVKSAKTVGNAWALVCPALKSAKIPVPEVRLPMQSVPDEDFLDYEQIKLFLDAIRGDDCEVVALLFLHSLRLSEALKLDVEDIKDNVIHVHGAVVMDKNNRLVEKTTNKNRSSTRDIPVMISRLTEILPAEGKAVTAHPSTIRRHIMAACEKAGVPACSPHDLRRSFSSLAFHLKWSELTVKAVGGWSDLNTVHKVYTKLAQKDANKDIRKMQNYYRKQTAQS